MALDPTLREQLTLPAICAPMFLVTGPDLVREACKAGIVAGLPRQNARSIEQFDQWLGDIRDALDRHRDAHPEARIGPIAANLATRFEPAELRAHLDVCRRHAVEIVITATGDPTELTKEVHDWGGKIFHDVVSMRFAEKAIRAGVDGLNCVGSGGGGHSGAISSIVLIPRIRQIYDGTIVMAGSISTGAQIRAAEMLGADLAYLGTRFIATQEADVDPRYKQMIVEGTSGDLMFTPQIAGVAANWLTESMKLVGLDPENLPVPQGRGMRHDHLPEGVRPWKNLWSAGQGIDLIDDVPSVADLVARLRREYVAACDLPSMADVARID